jgi:hypothetical protein
MNDICGEEKIKLAAIKPLVRRAFANIQGEIFHVWKYFEVLFCSEKEAR